MPPSTPNGLFDTLPSELRLQIWTHLLIFPNPLKYISGTPDSNLSILLANHQIYNEAHDILFAENTFLAARADFCLKRHSLNPSFLANVRHLVLTSFGESTQCGYYKTQCSCCAHPGDEFLNMLVLLPMLRTVVVDYHHHLSRFQDLKTALTPSEGDSTSPKLACTAVCTYIYTNTNHNRLASSPPRITFQHVPIAKTYPSLLAFASQNPLSASPPQALASLRKANPIFSTLYQTIVAANSSSPPASSSALTDRVRKFWLYDGKPSAAQLATFSDNLQDFLELEAPVLCRRESDTEDREGLERVVDAAVAAALD